MWKVGVVVISIFAIAFALLPVAEFLSWAEFKITPAFAKHSHFVRLKNRAKGQTIYLLGTIHEGHFERGSGYPYEELRSVLQFVKPDLLLVEIRPESLERGKWGEGPPEMPYAMAVAQEAGIRVAGMDFWRADYHPMRNFDEREDRMTELISEAAMTKKVTLVFTGYSHVAGIRHRLAAADFLLDTTFTTQAKIRAFSTPAPGIIPKSYFTAVQEAALRASKHLSDYPPEWAESRFRLLNRLESGQSH